MLQIFVPALLAVAGALAVYLAAPRQQLLRRPIPSWAGASLAALSVGAAWALRGDGLAWHTHFFIVLTLLLLAWALIPYAVAFARPGRGR